MIPGTTAFYVKTVSITLIASKIKRTNLIAEFDSTALLLRFLTRFRALITWKEYHGVTPKYFAWH